jgi:IclR family acetate operon transcriptional repressor
LVTESSEHALRYAIAVGARAPLHGLAAGKAILAAMPEDEFERYLRESRRESFTEATMVSAADLRREIALTRKRGYGRTGSEYSVGIEGLACAAMAGGEVIGAFAVAIPAVRFDDGVERRVADLLMRTAGLLDG